MKSDRDLREMMEALKGDYRRRLPHTLAQIDSAWAVLAEGGADAGCVKTLERALHSIAGAAGTFGMPALGDAAAAAESFVESCAAQGAIAEADERAHLASLLEAVRREAAK